ncbi:MAG: M15 family metallopeptidase [Bacilli bacterium]
MKKNIKIIFKSIMFICFSLCLIIIYYQHHYSTFKQLKKLNYTPKGINLIMKNNLDNYLLKTKIYSKTLETALTKDLYLKKYLHDYVFFEYKNYDKYIEHLNTLKDRGYKNDEINIILEFLTEEDLDLILKETKDYLDFTPFLTSNYFLSKNIIRYINYQDKYQLDYEETINKVNMNLDYPFYTNYKIIEDPFNNLVLVNKYNKLPSDFIPQDLTSLISACSINQDILVTKTLKKKFEEMCLDIKNLNLNIKVISGYRSYQTQEDLYNKYYQKDGTLADDYSARPGFSEHQTGLAVDIYNEELPFTKFKNTPEYQWVKNNAHRYGFIIRYPKDKEDITGYKEEPWHLRYLGEEIATYLYEHHLTYDEYYTQFIKK